MPSAWLRRSSPPQIWDVCSCEKELSPSHGSLPGEQLFQLEGSPEIHFSEPRCSGSVWEYQLPESSRADIPHSFQQQEPAKTFQGKGKGSVQLPLCHVPPSGWLSPGCDISWPRVTHSDTPGRSQCRVCYPESFVCNPWNTTSAQSCEQPHSLHQQLEREDVPLSRSACASRDTELQGRRTGGKSHPGKSRIKLDPSFYLLAPLENPFGKQS